MNVVMTVNVDSAHHSVPVVLVSNARASGQPTDRAAIDRVPRFAVAKTRIVFAYVTEQQSPASLGTDTRVVVTNGATTSGSHSPKEIET